METRFTKEKVLVAMEMQEVEVIFSYGAFEMFGLGFRIGERAYHFGQGIAPMSSPRNFLDTFTKDEIAEKICVALNGRRAQVERELDYCEKVLAEVMQKEMVRINR